MIFPVEIWEHIFLYVDPVTLINMRIVCKCWKNIIDKMLQVNYNYNFNCKILVLLMQLVYCVCVRTCMCARVAHV